jgi:hypothetical protein
MKFMTVREFRLNTGKARRSIEKDDDLVLTANGRPFAIVSRVHAESFDRELLAIRRARARVAVERLREEARADGTSTITMDEIDAVVRDNRRRTVNS